MNAADRTALRKTPIWPPPTEAVGERERGGPKAAPLGLHAKVQSEDAPRYFFFFFLKQGCENEADFVVPSVKVVVSVCCQ